MAVENANYINQLVETSPAPSDSISEGDGHLTLIKHVLKTSFPNVIDAPMNGIHVGPSEPQLDPDYGPGSIWFDTSTGLIKFRTNTDPQEWIIMGHGSSTGVGNLLKFTKNDSLVEFDYRVDDWEELHSFTIQPVSTESTLYFDISGQCTVGGFEALQENHLKFTSDGVDLSLDLKILGFNFDSGLELPAEINGMFNVKFWKENNDGMPFSVTAFGRHVGGGYSSVSKITAICQELA